MKAIVEIKTLSDEPYCEACHHDCPMICHDDNDNTCCIICGDLDGSLNPYRRGEACLSATAEYTKMAAKCQWISVNDRLPDDDTDCIITWGDEHFNWIAYYQDGKFKTLNNNREFDNIVDDVTHWMPIPELV